MSESLDKNYVQLGPTQFEYPSLAFVKRIADQVKVKDIAASRFQMKLMLYFVE